MLINARNIARDRRAINLAIEDNRRSHFAGTIIPNFMTFLRERIERKEDWNGRSFGTQVGLADTQNWASYARQVGRYTTMYLSMGK